MPPYFFSRGGGAKSGPPPLGRYLLRYAVEERDNLFLHIINLPQLNGNEFVFIEDSLFKTNHFISDIISYAYKPFITSLGKVP